MSDNPLYHCEPCMSGFQQHGMECIKDCPPGFEDLGTSCKKPSYHCKRTFGPTPPYDNGDKYSRVFYSSDMGVEKKCLDNSEEKNGQCIMNCPSDHPIEHGDSCYAECKPGYEQTKNFSIYPGLFCVEKCKSGYDAKGHYCVKQGIHPIPLPHKINIKTLPPPDMGQKPIETMQNLMTASYNSGTTSNSTYFIIVIVMIILFYYIIY